VTGTVAAIGVSGLVGLGVVSAQSAGNRSSLVEAIASRFNLNKSDVQKVFDQNKAQNQVDRQQKMSDRLQKLVDNGTITAAQKTAIEAKLKDLQASRAANRGSLKSLTPVERKAKMEAQKTDLENWANSQGLDLTRLQGIFMRGVPQGMGTMSPPPANQ